MSAVPWWIGRQARLALLLACLLAALLALLSTRTDVFSAAASGERKPRSWCGYVPPALAGVPFDEVRQLRATLLAVMEPVSPVRYAYGPVAPEVVWSDNPPLQLSSRPASKLWPASFEMRTWAPDPQSAGTVEDVVAEVFLFAGSRQADRFYTRAASARCHEAGIARPASRPRGARLLTWVNPDAVTQDDLLLLSGARVYRFSLVPPRQHDDQVSGAEQQAALTRIEGLACGIPAAAFSCLPRASAPPRASQRSGDRSALHGCVRARRARTCSEGR